MDTNTIQKNISTVIGLETLPEADQAVFLKDVGDVIMESALLRLVVDLSDDQVTALEQYIEDEPDSDMVLKHLLEHHKDFDQILQEEIIAFKEEAIAVMG